MLDVLITLVLVVEVTLELSFGTFRWDHGPLAIALGIASTLPLAARRRAPLVCALLVAVAVGAQVAFQQSSPAGSYFAGLLAAYSLVASTTSHLARLGGLLAMLAAFTMHLLFDSPPPIDAGNVLFTYGPLLAASAVGELQRQRHVRAGRVEARAASLEQEALELARRAAADERARIARELHDVVAHSMSVIVLQAGAARRIAEHDPIRARDALATIETSGRQALAEMRRLLTVMRGAQGDDPAERAPQPGLGQLDALVAQVGTAGLAVTVHIDGAPRVLPPSVDLSAYRIIQEALTNTLKHAPAATAEIAVHYRGDAVEVDVADHGSTRPGTRPAVAGHGLIGMRERVSLFGGQLRAEHDGDGFRVRAVLPVEWSQ